jgi:hypothetical protein
VITTVSAIAWLASEAVSAPNRTIHLWRFCNRDLDGWRIGETLGARGAAPS